MGISSNASRLTERFKRLRERYPEEIRRAMKENAEMILQKAQELSHGPLSSKTEELLGNPYAKAHPHPPIPPYIINDQGGTFARSWTMLEREDSSGPTYVVTNTAPHAKYLSGTSRMIPRPVLDAAIRLTERERQANLEQASRKGSSGS